MAREWPRAGLHSVHTYTFTIVYSLPPFKLPVTFTGGMGRCKQIANGFRTLSLKHTALQYKRKER